MPTPEEELLAVCRAVKLNRSNLLGQADEQKVGLAIRRLQEGTATGSRKVSVRIDLDFYFMNMPDWQLEEELRKHIDRRFAAQKTIIAITPLPEEG